MKNDQAGFVGGLTGGLFRLFEGVGEAFFVFLIGSYLASRGRRDSKIIAGGCVSSSIVGLIGNGLLGGLVGGSLPAAVVSAMAGAFLGAIIGTLLAWLILSYVRGVEAEIAREERQKHS